MVYYLKTNFVLNCYFSILTIVIAWAEGSQSKSDNNMKTFTFLATDDDIGISLYQGEEVAFHCSTTLKSTQHVNSTDPDTKHNIRWILPPKVKAYNASNSNPSEVDKKDSWIEVESSSRTLIFHNTDKTIQAPYVCEDGVQRITVQVTIRTKSSSSGWEGSRIVSGVVASLIFIVICLTGYLVHRWYERRKQRKYSPGNLHNREFEIIIPTIEIIDEKGEKVNTTVYDFM